MNNVGILSTPTTVNQLGLRVQKMQRLEDIDREGTDSTPPKTIPAAIVYRYRVQGLHVGS